MPDGKEKDVSKKKDKYPQLVTAAGTAVFPKLNAADTKFKPEGEYSVKLRLTGEEATDLASKIQAFRDEAYKAELVAQGKDKLKKAPLPFKNAVDRETEEEIAGAIDFNFKMKAKITSKQTGKSWEQKPQLFDAHKRPTQAEVWGGSTLKVAFQMRPWLSPLGFGIALDLKAVQVLELVTRGERNADSFGFGEEEGWADEDTQAPAGSDDESEGSGSDSDGEDF